VKDLLATLLADGQLLCGALLAHNAKQKRPDGSLCR
jgi:hypothetical protein